jgi:hypothetical protein
MKIQVYSDRMSYFKIVAADAGRAVALGAKTDEEALYFFTFEPRYLGCYGVLKEALMTYAGRIGSMPRG